MNSIAEINRINQRELELGLAGKGSWHDQYKDSAYIFVGGLPYDLSEGDVVTIFSQWGEIVNINMPRDKETGKSKGFAFVMYDDQRSTILAVDNMNGCTVLNRTLRVDHCRKYNQPGEKNAEGEHVAPEEPTYNVMPPTIGGDDESESSESEAGDSWDEEDPMAAYLRAEKKKEKLKIKDKGKRKHEKESKEERRARKEAKRAKRVEKEASKEGKERRRGEREGDWHGHVTRERADREERHGSVKRERESRGVSSEVGSRSVERAREDRQEVTPRSRDRYDQRDRSYRDHDDKLRRDGWEGDRNANGRDYNRRPREDDGRLRDDRDRERSHSRRDDPDDRDRDRDRYAREPPRRYEEDGRDRQNGYGRDVRDERDKGNGYRRRDYDDERDRR